MSPTAQIVRVILRYLAGILVSAGLLGAGTGDALANDPLVAEAATHAVNWALTAIGTAIGGVTEVWFGRDMKKGSN